VRQWFRGTRRFSRNLVSKTQSPLNSLKRRATTVCVSHDYLPLPAEAATALFQVVSQRYGKGSIALTTNLGVASSGRILDDSTVAAAMLDRLPHRSVVFNINGDSYRMRAHRARAEQVRKGWSSTQEDELARPVRDSSA
jgi:IstB-like ATP binding protein